MFKKTLSVLLAVMMVVSVLTVGVVSSNAATSAGFEPDAGKFYFDIDGAVDSTGATWASLMGTKGKVAFYICGGDLDTEANPTKPIAWGGKKAIGTATAGETGIFEFDPAAKLGTLTDGVQYKIIFVRVDGSNWKDQTYDLFFTTDCLGHVAKCDGTFTENPVDSSKKTATAYWDDAIDPSENGPVKGITSIGNVVGSCNEMGKTDYDVFTEFFTEEKTDFQGKTGYQNAHGYVCEISESSPNYKSEQKLIDDIGAGLGLTKDDVKNALEDDAVKAKLADGPGCSWDYEKSTLPGGEVPHQHIPGQPVEENIVEPGCETPGSHDKVVYCTECGEELSRESVVDKALGHIDPLEYVAEVPATASVDGMKEHYKCTRCGKLFYDDKGENVADPEDLVIKAEHVRGDANGDGVFDEIDVTVLQRYLVELPVTDNFDGIAADADLDGIIDVIDVTLMQRVLANMTTWEKWDEKHPKADA